MSLKLKNVSIIIFTKLIVKKIIHTMKNEIDSIKYILKFVYDTYLSFSYESEK